MMVVYMYFADPNAFPQWKHHKKPYNFESGVSGGKLIFTENYLIEPFIVDTSRIYY